MSHNRSKENQTGNSNGLISENNLKKILQNAGYTFIITGTLSQEYKDEYNLHKKTGKGTREYNLNIKNKLDLLSSSFETIVNTGDFSALPPGKYFTTHLAIYKDENTQSFIVCDFVLIDTINKLISVIENKSQHSAGTSKDKFYCSIYQSIKNTNQNINIWLICLDVDPIFVSVGYIQNLQEDLAWLYPHKQSPTTEICLMKTEDALLKII